jgi:hypothetical protein
MAPNGAAAQGNTRPKGERASNLDIGELTKIGAVSAALAYAMGMLTINTYLHKLGIADFSFARPKLILTGVLASLSFFLLALLPVFVAWRLADDGRPKRPHSLKILFLLFLPLLALFGASLYLCFGTIGLGQITVWGIWELINQITVWVGWDLKKQRNLFTEILASVVVTAEVYFPICVAAGSAFVASKLFQRQRAQDDSRLNPERIYLLLSVALAVISVLGYMIIFSLTFYAAIPQAFGGGKPYFESFVIAEDGRCELQQLGMPFADGQPNVTKPLPVLHESDNTVAVWLETTAPQEGSDTRARKGSRQAIVVQLDKRQISASMAYPHGKNTPNLTSPPAPCTLSSTSGAVQNTR